MEHDVEKDAGLDGSALDLVHCYVTAVEAFP